MQLGTMDPLVVSLVAVGVALITLLFGPGIVLRTVRALKAKSQRRKVHRQEIWKFLTRSAVFFDGLPLFVDQTWEWGSSVPNYSPREGFPDQRSIVPRDYPDLGRVVGSGLRFYSSHSRTGGRVRAEKGEALTDLAEIQRDFWMETKACVRSEWRITWRRKLRDLKRLKIQPAERGRIEQLRRQREDGS